jgi:hypothetical protein
VHGAGPGTSGEVSLSEDLLGDLPGLVSQEQGVQIPQPVPGRGRGTWLGSLIQTWCSPYTMMTCLMGVGPRVCAED